MGSRMRILTVHDCSLARFVRVSSASESRDDTDSRLSEIAKVLHFCDCTNHSDSGCPDLGFYAPAISSLTTRSFMLSTERF